MSIVRLAEYMRDDNTVRYDIVRTTDGRIVGSCEFRRNSELGNYGYGIDEEYRGNGYATAALVELVKTVRTLGIGKTSAYVRPDNPASARVCGKAGGIYAGIAELPPGSPHRAYGCRSFDVFVFDT